MGFASTGAAGGGAAAASGTAVGPRGMGPGKDTTGTVCIAGKDWTRWERWEAGEASGLPVAFRRVWLDRSWV